MLEDVEYLGNNYPRGVYVQHTEDYYVAKIEKIRIEQIPLEYIPDTIARTTYVDEKIASIPTPDISGQISGHNEDGNAHATKFANYYTKPEVEQFHDEIKDYVDDEVAALVNSAPETLDTLGELATAFEENAEVVDALNSSIANKQDKVSDTLILTDTITGVNYKIQIQNGQLVSIPMSEV